jgi:hypothetical protein
MWLPKFFGHYFPLVLLFILLFFWQGIFFMYVYRYAHIKVLYDTHK